MGNRECPLFRYLDYLCMYRDTTETLAMEPNRICSYLRMTIFVTYSLINLDELSFISFSTNPILLYLKLISQKFVKIFNVNNYLTRLTPSRIMSSLFEFQLSIFFCKFSQVEPNLLKTKFFNWTNNSNSVSPRIWPRTAGNCIWTWLILVLSWVYLVPQNYTSIVSPRPPVKISNEQVNELMAFVCSSRKARLMTIFDFFLGVFEHLNRGQYIIERSLIKEEFGTTSLGRSHDSAKLNRRRGVTVPKLTRTGPCSSGTRFSGLVRSIYWVLPM